MKSKRRNAEEEIQEEKRLYLAFKNGKKSSKTRLRLDFEGKTILDHNDLHVQALSETGLVTMVIDDISPVVSGNEVFKRNLEDGEKGSGGERFVH